MEKTNKNTATRQHTWNAVAQDPSCLFGRAQTATLSALHTRIIQRYWNVNLKTRGHTAVSSEAITVPADKFELCIKFCQTILRMRVNTYLECASALLKWLHTLYVASGLLILNAFSQLIFIRAGQSRNELYSWGVGWARDAERSVGAYTNAGKLSWIHTPAGD